MAEATVKNKEHLIAIAVDNLNNRVRPYVLFSKEQKVGSGIILYFPADEFDIMVSQAFHDAMRVFGIPNLDHDNTQGEAPTQGKEGFSSECGNYRLSGEESLAKLANAGVKFPGCEFYKTEKGKSWAKEEQHR